MKFLIFNMVVGASLVYLVTAEGGADRNAVLDGGRVVAQSEVAPSATVPIETASLPVETVAQPVPEPVVQPLVQPVPEPLPEPEVEPVVQPVAQPEPESKPQPAPEPVTVAASQEQDGAVLQVGRFEIAEPENLMSARERSAALRALARDMELKFLDRR